LLFAGLIYLAQKKYRDSISGVSLSYGKALLIGLLSSVVAAILLVVYNYIFFKYVNPGMLEIMQEQAQLKVMEQDLSAEIEEIVLDSQAKFMTAGWISVFSTFGVILQGFLVSLITSLFSKGTTPLDEDEMEEIESE
jgi:fructose-specific phosphotransferase system IIC component